MMPFITEELWQQIPHEGEALIVAPWPETDESRFDETAEREVDLIQRIVGTVRNIRGGFRVPPSRKADVLIKTMAKEVEEIVESNREIITDLARADNLEVGHGQAKPPSSATGVLKEAEIYVPLEGLIDLTLERARIQKEMDRLTGVISGIDRKLNNSDFVSKAPEKVVAKERQKRDDCDTSLSRLRENLESIKG